MKAVHADPHLTQKLPPNILFGTSSWNYPGWQGQVYHRDYKDEKDLRERSLEEYVRFPWFRTVGIDSSFYGPPHPRTLARYAEQVPVGFCWVSKVWEEITIPTYARHKRYGERAGKANQNFLNPSVFTERALTPYLSSDVRSHIGPFVFQFQAFYRPTAVTIQKFLSKLDGFFGALPREFDYAVEVRNREILTPEYFAVLNRHRVTHCFNHWTNMPRLMDQMKSAADAGGLAADFYVARILTPIGVPYQDAVEMFQPYGELKLPIQTMREDVVRLAKRGTERGVATYILVNNRAEGNAPGTIDAIGRMIIESGVRTGA